MTVVIVSFATRMPTILEARQEFGTPQPRTPCATDQATPAAAAIMMKIASQRPTLRPGSSSGWFAAPLWRADDEVNISERYAPDMLEARTCITNYENTGARDPRPVPPRGYRADAQSDETSFQAPAGGVLRTGSSFEPVRLILSAAAIP
jgi:hypothetical protein